MNSTTVLISGASRGIGKALAFEMARRGFDIFITARNEKALVEISEKINSGTTKCFHKKCDVSRKEDVYELIAESIDALGRIDYAVLNAGIGGGHMSREFCSDNLAEIYHTNLFGVVYALDKLIPQMKMQGEGLIAAVSSLADARGFPGSISYSSSKAALTQIFEGLRMENTNKKIRFVTIKPGFVKTDMTAKHKFKMPFLMDADKAARIIANGLESGKANISFPAIMAFFSWMGKATPSVILEPIIRLWYGKEKGKL